MNTVGLTPRAARTEICVGGDGNFPADACRRRAARLTWLRGHDDDVLCAMPSKKRTPTPCASTVSQYSGTQGTKFAL
jgi:hypothetical protein